MKLPKPTVSSRSKLTSNFQTLNPPIRPPNPSAPPHTRTEPLPKTASPEWRAKAKTLPNPLRDPTGSVRVCACICKHLLAAEVRALALALAGLCCHGGVGVSRVPERPAVRGLWDSCIMCVGNGQMHM